MSQIAINPPVCLAYISHEAEADFLALSLEVMSSYDWITHIIVLHTDRDGTERYINGAMHYYKDFGRGFESQPEHGGFHELGARNALLDLARKAGCPWILLCDPDEFFTPVTINCLRQAHDCKKQIVCFACYHFVTPGSYVWWPDQVRLIQSKQYHDPHVRAVLSDCNLIYRMNSNNRFRRHLKNRTMHCHLQWPAKTKRFHSQPETIYHVHVHHMLQPKRPSGVWLTRQEIRSDTAGIMPENYIRVWEQQS